MKYIIATFVFIVLFGAVAHAEQTRFKQQILPIDCVYEIIDVGTQTLRYLTPDTCPVDPGPPVITTEDVPSNPSTINTSQPQRTYAPTIEVSPPVEEGIVKGDIVRITEGVYRNIDALIFIVAAVIAWFGSGWWYTKYKLKTKK
jgi:hypothetical protein